ncbi:Enoyl-[acyl-carrier-protein] reductase [NADH] [Pseudomonas gessardii]|uniref:Enoyl-[acyl-carrier-protein] reductase [NADH] n=1 Tax=Pseudomonas gessardii TaxID=78544 RepID=A0A7Y1QMV4_9PSED|nr:SDR family oxidoreductase [Pseudomonas gessardii]MRU52984.1 SDR family oxidoreductase [Pseudomonas gessardii]NNA97234.1 SDR family oxidoreductase [Pseudomonas gessardii]SDQ67980.1 Enoyl-[acyl-carrier-protein] reductase [NADH] [Pseudomonas gessardii]
MNLSGKRGVVLGVLNKKSMAAACASRLMSAGAEVICSYLPVKGDEERRHILATRAIPSMLPEYMLPCDVTNDSSIESFFNAVAEIFGEIDFIVHGVSLISSDATIDNLAELPRQAFHTSMDVSVYSMLAISKYAKAHMSGGGSIITFSYLSADSLVPGYELLGVCKAALQASASYLAFELRKSNIRVNVISAPPFPSSSAIGHTAYSGLCDAYAKKLLPAAIPSIDEILNVAVFLISDLSTGVSGERIFVDGGFHNMSAAI